MAASSYFEADWSALDDIAPALRQYLNIPNLRPLLRAKHLLTGDELEQVEISAANTTSQAIDRFVSILKSKGPDHAEVFLEVLQLSLEQSDYHLGHKFLSQKLESVVVERKARHRSLDERDERALREAARAIPVGHREVRHNDSGLGIHGSISSSENSSQDTGSPRSTFSCSGASLGFDGNKLSHPMRHLRMGALDNIDSEGAHHGLNEQQVSILRRKIVGDTNNIISRFAVMVVGVYRLLKQSNTPVDEVRIMLQFLGCHTTKKSDSVTMFSESDEISKSRDLSGLIECLRKYSSWYNYRLMKVVAEQFAGDEGKKLIADYEADLRKHYVGLIAHHCPDFTLEEGIPPGYTRLIVKVNWDYWFTNMQDVATFEASLAEILELQQYVFQLRSVEEGCVHMEWALPAALESHVADIMGEKKECLKDLNVLSIEILTLPPQTSAWLFIDKHTHSPKGSKISLAVGGTCLPHMQCKPSLSGSSSIISILDQPMPSDEAELLSLYDSESSRAASMHEESGLSHMPPLSFMDSAKECGNKWEGTLYECDCCEGDFGHDDACRYSDVHCQGSDSDIQMNVTSSNENSSPEHENPTSTLPSGELFSTAAHVKSSTNLFLPITATPVCMRRVCASESNLLAAQLSPIQKSQDGHSLPNILTPSVGSGLSRSPRPSKLTCRLRKIPWRILRRLFLSDKRRRDNVKEGTTYSDSPTLLSTPFPLLDLTEEPRRIGASRVPVLKIDDLHLSQSKLPADESQDSDLVSFPTSLDGRRDSAVPYSPSASPTGLQVYPGSERRDSAVPSSPSSSASFMDGLSPVSRPKRDHSFRSDGSRPSPGSYQHQSSLDSMDSVSLNSIPTQFASKRNSYSSHFYASINPILEYPDDSQSTEVQESWESRHKSLTSPSPSQSSDNPQEAFESRERSRSLNESYVRSVHRHLKQQVMPSGSRHSSGYASFAGSVAHVDRTSMHSQDSLLDGACGDAKSNLYPQVMKAVPSDAFPSAPRSRASVQRGGSLKASVKFQTYADKPSLYGKNQIPH